MSKDGIYICAELGVGWWGDHDVLDLAVSTLAGNGVDAIKLQYFDEELLASYERHTADALESMILTPGRIIGISEMLHAEGHETDLIVTPFSLDLMKSLNELPKGTIDGIKIRARDWRNKEMRNYTKNLGLPTYISVPQDVVIEKTDRPANKTNAKQDDSLLSLDTAFVDARSKYNHRIYCVPKYPPMPEEMKLGYCTRDYDGASIHSDNIFDHYTTAVINTFQQWDVGTKRRFYLEVHTYPEWEKKSNVHSAFDYDVSLSIRDVVRLKEACDRLEETIG